MRPMNVIDPDPTYIPNTCILFENQVNYLSLCQTAL